MTAQQQSARRRRRAKLVPVGGFEFRQAKLEIAREKYGIDVAGWEDLLYSQRNSCAVCDTSFEAPEQMCVDHDHATGYVRGILCFGCNIALGHASESPDTLRALADYLERHPGLPSFNPTLLSTEDRALARKIVGSAARLRRPDFVVAPDGEAYLYRWYVVPRNDVANCYFHVQVADDPQRPLHDHYYDNQSVILAGGYVESMHEVVRSYGGQSTMRTGREVSVIRRPGDVIQRKAEEAHRLALPPGVPYSMSLFTTGPRRRMWGFHYPNGWRPYDDVTETHDGVSVHKESTP